jgi:hypothetical protein
MPKHFSKKSFEEYKAQFTPEQLSSLKNPDAMLRAGYQLTFHTKGLTRNRLKKL